ncbi:MAG: Na+/H+ antiporter NhaA [Planctomycetaceae bacterium]
MQDSQAAQVVPLPHEPIHKLVGPLARFLHVQAAGGLVLLICTFVALIAANSGFGESFLSFWMTPAGIRVGAWGIEHSFVQWINDGLMVVFFFVVGLEIKREIVFGELGAWRTASLPIAAAAGGMVVPAGIYLAFQWGEAGERGWGIPMATDIAFVVGALALMGSRVPHGLRVFLLSLAIVDDLGAILVIAIAYSSHLNPLFLLWGLMGIALIVLIARLGVRSVPIYVLAGTGVWFCFHESGVHATIAGVVLALLTPVRPWISASRLGEIVEQMRDFLSGDDAEEPPHRREVLHTMEIAARETLSPLERLEVKLHPWVSFVIMPLFALANAGVAIRTDSLSRGLAWAVVAGLVLGKPLGVLAFTWLTVRLRLGRLPAGTSWKLMTAGAVLTGIGFTMSLFIAGLALDEELLAAAKVGILVGSTACALTGMALLRRSTIAGECEA